MFAIKEICNESENKKLNELFAARFKQNSNICVKQINIKFDYEFIEAIKKQYEQVSNTNDSYKKIEIQVLETTIEQLKLKKYSAVWGWSAITLIIPRVNFKIVIFAAVIVIITECFKSIRINRNNRLLKFNKMCLRALKTFR